MIQVILTSLKLQNPLYCHHLNQYSTIQFNEAIASLALPKQSFGQKSIKKSEAAKKPKKKSTMKDQSI